MKTLIWMRVWKLQSIVTDEEGISKKHESAVHKLIKKVTNDYDTAGFNTAIAAMMGFINDLYADGYVTKGELIVLIKLFNPVAPHICEEMYQELGGEGLLALAQWPTWDESKLLDDTVNLPVQIGGKMRGIVVVPRDCDLDTVRAAVMEGPLAKFFQDKTVVKEIYVPNRICNFIVK